MVQPQHLPSYTYADYAQWEGNWELIKGIPYAMSPAPNRKHQRINSQLVRQFANELDNCNENCDVYIPIDWKIDEKTVVQPDISVVCGTWNNENYLDFPPELVVEILSPSNAIKDLNLKFELYQNAAVRYYVIIDPKKETVAIYEYTNGKYELVKEMRSDVYSFDIQGCIAKIDFAKMW